MIVRCDATYGSNSLLLLLLLRRTTAEGNRAAFSESIGFRFRPLTFSAVQCRVQRIRNVDDELTTWLSRRHTWRRRRTTASCSFARFVIGRKTKWITRSEFDLRNGKTNLNEANNGAAFFSLSECRAGTPPTVRYRFYFMDFHYAWRLTA